MEAKSSQRVDDTPKDEMMIQEGSSDDRVLKQELARLVIKK